MSEHAYWTCPKAREKKRAKDGRTRIVQSAVKPSQCIKLEKLAQAAGLSRGDYLYGVISKHLEDA